MVCIYVLHELEPSFTFVLLCMLSVDDLTHFQLLVCDIRYPLLTKNLNNTGDLRDFSLNSLWCFQQKHQFEFASKKYANSRLSAFYFRNWDNITLATKSVYYMYRRISEINTSYFDLYIYIYIYLFYQNLKSAYIDSIW